MRQTLSIPLKTQVMYLDSSKANHTFNTRKLKINHELILKQNLHYINIKIDRLSIYLELRTLDAMVH